MTSSAAGDTRARSHRRHEPVVAGGSRLRPGSAGRIRRGLPPPDPRLVAPRRLHLLLLRVERTPMHPQWVAAIAGGSIPGHTLLGTSPAPLSPHPARAR